MHYDTFVQVDIGVPRILKWRGFTWWGAGPRGLGHFPQS